MASGEPIITFFQVGCSDVADFTVGALITHTNGTVRSDLPMGPGSYPITGGLFDADGPPGTMIADFTETEGKLYGTVGGSGSVEITRWDNDKIVGSASFTAVEAFADNPEEIMVTVTFDIGCDLIHSGC